MILNFSILPLLQGDRAGMGPPALIKLKNAYSKRGAYMFVIVMRKYGQT